MEAEVKKILDLLEEYLIVVGYNISEKGSYRFTLRIQQTKELHIQVGIDYIAIKSKDTQNTDYNYFSFYISNSKDEKTILILINKFIEILKNAKYYRSSFDHFAIDQLIKKLKLLNKNLMFENYL